MRTTQDLARLRGELDLIDDELLDLVGRRLALSALIAAAKTDDGGHLKLRPARQRAVVARLQAKASAASAGAVADIWRELMAHSLQRQAPTRLLLWTDGDREALARLARERFGSAAPLDWAAGPEEALRRAQAEEAVAILSCRWLGPLPAGLTAFDRLDDEAGSPVARAIGRVEAEAEAAPVLPAWSPAGWRRREALQMPVYPDPRALEAVERRLRTRAPLVELHDIDRLRRQLGEVAEGKAFLLQGGDCAESFREFSPGKVASTADLLLELGRTLAAAAGAPVVHVARMAGQFAKPRSAATERVGGVDLPAYRGDGVNGAEPTPAARAPDPERLLRAHDQAAATARLLCAHVADGGEPLYASHEALLLPYEQALTRYDERSGRWWAGSGHMLWIGDRTRGLEGAHVEHARGIANPLGLKCGPDLEAEDLLRLIERLDPGNAPGRLTLIARLGRDRIADRLPRLMRATAAAGRRVAWTVDPMHGNTRLAAGRKTRFFGDIAAETRSFFEIAAAEGVWAGGLHLELTGMAVTECLGGRRPVFERDLGRRYLTACDPRLNPDQARELAWLAAREAAPRPARAA
jgi:3-deoxy-7-phosphoheptulonate synthase